MASKEDLEQAENELECLRMKYPDACKDVAEFFERNRGVGYKNLCKMLMGEATPADLAKDGN